jgi:hypothetical protein
MEAERILHLRWEHVDLERGLIFMPDSGRKYIGSMCPCAEDHERLLQPPTQALEGSGRSRAVRKGFGRTSPALDGDMNLGEVRKPRRTGHGRRCAATRTRWRRPILAGQGAAQMIGCKGFALVQPRCVTVQQVHASFAIGPREIVSGPTLAI